MASRLNFHQTNVKQNYRLKSAQRISYTYLNFNISNQNYNKINKRVQSNLKTKNTNKPIQNNKYNHQMNIFSLPYIALNHNFINNLQGITTKKDYIQNNKRSIDVYRYSSNNKNRNKIFKDVYRYSSNNKNRNKKSIDVYRYSSNNKNRNKIKNNNKKKSLNLKIKSLILSNKKYNNERKKDLEEVKKNLDKKEFQKKEDAKGIKKEEKKENQLKENEIYKNLNVENNRNNRHKHIFLKTNNNSKAIIKKDKSIIIEEKKVIKEDKNEIKEDTRTEEKGEKIDKKENIKEIKKELYKVNIKKKTEEIKNEKEKNDEDKKSIKNEIEKEKEQEIMTNKKEEEIMKSENIEIKETSENIKKINEINLNNSNNMGKYIVKDLKTKSKNEILTNTEKKVYQEIPFKHELKTYSPICDKCFRLVYISFDYISDCISSYCLYCKNLSVYKYDAFIEKMNENKNPLLNCYCNKCFKSFIFSDSSNPIYLIEKMNYNFFIICKECLEKNKCNEYVKIYKCQELISHYLYLYENDNNKKNKLDNIKNLEKQSEKINEKIKLYLNIYDMYKSNISKIELIIKNAPLSIRNHAQEKLLQLKKELIIKNKIIEFYNQYRNFIIINNITSLLHTILDFSNFDLNKFTDKSRINDIYNLIQRFINYKKFISLENLDKPINFEDFSLITKNYLNKEQCIKDKNEPKELLLNQSFLDVLNINFITGKTIRYNILADYCSSEKVVPINYNYNQQDNNVQDILICNYKNDHKLYYCTYDPYLQQAFIESAHLLINEESNNILKIFLLNYGEDIFILCNDMNFNMNMNNSTTTIYYINDFRKNNNNIKKYKVARIYFFEDKLIYNQSNACIKMRKKLILIGKNKFKEIYLPNDNYINNNMMNNNMMINNIIMNNNNNINNNMNNINNNFNNHNIINMNMNNIFNNNNINNMNNNFNFMNNMNNNFNNNFNNMNLNNNFNNNINNMNNNFNNHNMNNINNINHFNFNNNMNNNFNNHNMNNINNMNNMNNMNHFNFINNMNNMNMNNNNILMNNNMNFNNMMMPNFNNNIFYNNEFGEKSLYLDIMNLDNNYFIIGSSKHIKDISNKIKSYFYLALFSYDTLEEINKIEIDVIEKEQSPFSSYNCNFSMKVDKNNISIHINAPSFSNDYNYEFKDLEIIPK